MRAVYCALDPATAMLELGVNKGCEPLNAVGHVLSSAVRRIHWTGVLVVQPADVPNKLWLYPCAFSAGQQAFGYELLRAHDFVAIPSAVSRRSWNLIFDADRAAGKYELRDQE